MWLTDNVSGSSGVWCLAGITVTTATPWCLPQSSAGCIRLWHQKNREMAYVLSATAAGSLRCQQKLLVKVGLGCCCVWQQLKPRQVLLQAAVASRLTWEQAARRRYFWDHHSCLLMCPQIRFPQHFLLLAYRRPGSIFSWQNFLLARKTVANLRENLRGNKAVVVFTWVRSWDPVLVCTFWKWLHVYKPFAPMLLWWVKSLTFFFLTKTQSAWGWVLLVSIYADNMLEREARGDPAIWKQHLYFTPFH